jgi:DNA (cytosine-5)-methyltransferase 1
MRGADVRELIVDSFAGGGGASTGIEMALGRSPDIAVNHDAIALAMHEVNHPQTRHLTSDIWSVDPREATCGRPVGLLWASPDCKHFSKAKGGKPVEKKIRDLAWVVVHWANVVAPRVIILENVEEFSTWGPLSADGRPCPLRKGSTFDRWVGELRRLGYAVDWRELRACDYGAPTIRKRLFLIARRDGLPIAWPAPTHGDPKLDAVRQGILKPWRTAAEIIDWSLPCPSIFDTSDEILAKYGLRAIRPLQLATMARIAKGVKRYVLDAARPFIVPITHTRDAERGQAIDEPLCTITSAHRGEQALIAPHLMTMRNADKPYQGLDEPSHTVTAGGAHMHLVAAFLAQHNIDGRTRQGNAGRAADAPLSTIMQSGSHQGLAAVNLLRQFGTGVGSSLDEPARTVMADGQGKTQLCAAFLQKYYGADQDPRLDDPLHTATAKARFGLVTVQVEGVPYVITDIGMRMLTPRELFRAQGFPDSYVIDRKPDGSPISKTEQVSKCGNSVCPPIAAALVKANFVPDEVKPAPEFLEAAE